MKFNSKTLSLILNLLFCLFVFIIWILVFTHKFWIVSPLSDTFDDFVDDLLSSDVNLLEGELDFLLMQHLFYSIDLKLINKNETKDDQSLAA